MKGSEYTDSVLFCDRFQLVHGGREMFIVIPQHIALLMSWDGTNYVYMESSCRNEENMPARARDIVVVGFPISALQP